MDTSRKRLHSTGRMLLSKPTCQHNFIFSIQPLKHEVACSDMGDELRSKVTQERLARFVLIDRNAVD
jgi:hypothetical protein